MKYLKAGDGDWIRPEMTGHRIMCRDCRLVHTINFRVVKGRVEFQAARNPRAKGAARRKIKRTTR